jgi:hypothetical protein
MALPVQPVMPAMQTRRVIDGSSSIAGMRQRPVIWKPRYATRRMRERAWAQADRRREEAAGTMGRSWLDRLLRRR